MDASQAKSSTKEKIFLAAAELFANSSYAAVSVREIAEKVGIRAASIYNHYASKEEILDDIINTYVVRVNRFVEQQKNRMVQPGYKMTVRDIQFIYDPEEIQLMFWVTRIVYTEQFASKRAADILFGAHDERYSGGQRRLLEQLYERGLIKSARNIPIYAEMMARLAQSYQTDFVHPGYSSQVADLNDMYVYFFDLILSHEGSYDRRDEVIRDHVHGDPPALEK